MPTFYTITTMKTIGIIGGKGVMGKFFATLFRKKGFKILISDIGTKLTNQELVEKSDVVFFSVPMHLTEKIIEEVIPYTKKGQLLVDFTSLKIMPIKAMMKSKSQVIGLHPMFRPSGTDIKNQSIVICTGRAEQRTIEEVKKWFEEEGAKMVGMTAKEHDHLMSIVQVLLHFHTIALGNTLAKISAPLAKTLTIASPIYRLELDMIGRIFSQDPGLYAAIEILNPESKKMIQALMQETKKLATIVEKKDFTSFKKHFKKTSKFLGTFQKQATEEVDHILKNLPSKAKNKKT